MCMRASVRGPGAPRGFSLSAGDAPATCCGSAFHTEWRCSLYPLVSMRKAMVLGTAQDK